MTVYEAGDRVALHMGENNNYFRGTVTTDSIETMAGLTMRLDGATTRNTFEKRDWQIHLLTPPVPTVGGQIDKLAIGTLFTIYDGQVTFVRVLGGYMDPSFPEQVWQTAKATARDTITIIWEGP